VDGGFGLSLKRRKKGDKHLSAEKICKGGERYHSGKRPQFGVILKTTTLGSANIDSNLARREDPDTY